MDHIPFADIVFQGTPSKFTSLNLNLLRLPIVIVNHSANRLCTVPFDYVVNMTGNDPVHHVFCTLDVYIYAQDTYT